MRDNVPTTLNCGSSAYNFCYGKATVPFLLIVAGVDEAVKIKKWSMLP